MEAGADRLAKRTTGQINYIPSTNRRGLYLFLFISPTLYLFLFFSFFFFSVWERDSLCYNKFQDEGNGRRELVEGRSLLFKEEERE